MKSPRAFLMPPALFLFVVAGATVIDYSGAMPSIRGDAIGVQSAFDKREAAYRANNIGAALLEQYKAKEAVESFTRALEIKPDLLLARINLSIALYYLPDADGAKREAEGALIRDANAPQPHYILGLIARAQNRFDEAITEFQKVLKIDADDVGSNINVGQIFAQQKKYAEAIAAFRRSVEAEPYNETALYNLGILLTRTGHKEEGQRVLQKFQEFKQSGAGTTLGTNYLEGGHYAEAVVSTGAEAELVDRRTPEVVFSDATEVALPPFRNLKIPKSQILGQSGGDIALFDFDGDGDLDLIEAPPGHYAIGTLVDNHRLGSKAREVVGLLEQQPTLVSAVFAAAAANQVPDAPQLFAVALLRYRSILPAAVTERSPESGHDDL